MQHYNIVHFQNNIMDQTLANSQEPQTPDHVELNITYINESQRTAVIADKKNKKTLTVTPILARFHAGYFRISLSLCGQALLWKTLGDSSSVSNDSHALRRALALLPSTAFLLLWCLALFSILFLSLLYLLRCLFHFNLVRSEFLHHVGVNYLFAPWISLLLLLQSSPLEVINGPCHDILWWAFVVPVIILDVKIYGQWLTKGKRLLSAGANPASQLSVIGNLVGAHAAGPGEVAVGMFALGMVHYLVLFVTLYQRLPGNNGSLPAGLRPVFFLFFAAPGMASLAWQAISGSFDVSAKMFFYLSIFLFISLVCRPRLFKKSMRKFSVAWWAYSFPLTVLALASAEYAQEVKGSFPHVLMLLLSALSVLVSLALMLFSAFNTKMLFPDRPNHFFDSNTNSICTSPA